MAYYGYQPEQTKAQIRSTRGETIDLALPVSCLVGELRAFLIEEYNYDPNTRLLYNGLIADDNSYVCDYPFGSLMIATPADMQPHRQPLPPRQQQLQQVHQQQQLLQQLQQQRLQEPARTSPRTSSRPASGGSRKNRQGEQVPANNNNNNNNNAARRANPADGSQSSGKKSKSRGPIVKNLPKRSPPKTNSTSTESNSSDNAAPQPPAPVDASQPPPVATRDRTSPNNHNNTGSACGQPNRVNSARNLGSARTAVATQDASEPPASSPPATTAVPAQSFTPPPPTTQAQAPATAAPPVSAEAAANDDDNEEVSHRLRVRFTVECHIPSLQRLVPVQMNGESSVVDLMHAVLAEAPEIGVDAQVVFRGKVLPQNAQTKLFDLGIRTDTRVFIAAGEYSNPETITLLEVEEDTAEIDKAMKTNLTDLQRKGYYEELMRILFRTDGLQSLEGEWRQRRKDAVKRITALQDALGVEGKGA